MCDTRAYPEIERGALVAARGAIAAGVTCVACEILSCLTAALTGADVVSAPLPVLLLLLLLLLLLVLLLAP